MGNGTVPIVSGSRRLIEAILTADWTPGAKRDWRDVPFEAVDWEGLPAIACRRRLRPMLATALREAGWPHVPTPVRTAIEEAEQACSRMTVQHFALLSRLAAAAKARSVRLIALKGVALSLRLYGSPFIRDSNDIDLLVHHDDMAQLHDILVAENCVPISPGPPLSPRQMRILERYRHHDRYRHQPSETVIESHWSLDRNPHFIATDFDALWQARDVIALPHGDIAVLGGDDLVLQLGTHAAHHEWERWNWITDFVALFRRASEADLERIRTKAARDSNQDLFDSWLLVVRDMTDFAIAPALLKRAENNRRATAIARAALHPSAQNRRRVGRLSSHDLLRNAALRLRLKHTPAYLAYEIGAAFYRDDDWYALRLPDRLIWLYFVFRPMSFLFRLFKRNFA